MLRSVNVRFLIVLAVASVCIVLSPSFVAGQIGPIASVLTVSENAEESDSGGAQTLAEAKVAGARASSFRGKQTHPPQATAPQPQLDVFHSKIAPVFEQACVSCHGPDTQEGGFRVDTLDPNLHRGEDVSWWLEVFKVVSNGEMPPEDEAPLADADRSQIVDWLSSEIQAASVVRRTEKGHSSFRRMTRYETNYALQDLLGLPYEFTGDLPPEAASSDGFQNSSDVLQMSAAQFEYYRDLSRKALEKATVRGEQPVPYYWGIAMQDSLAELQVGYDKERKELREKFQDDPEQLEKELARHAARASKSIRGTHVTNLDTGLAFRSVWRYNGARYAWTPSLQQPVDPPVSDTVAVIPSGQKLIVELGNLVPDAGTLRIRIRASQAASAGDGIPSLRLEMGFQASNNSSASKRISGRDVAILATADKPEFYQWDIPLAEIALRNPMRRTAKMGKTPNPSEYLKLHNTSLSRADVQIDYIEVTAPVYAQWPPESHRRIFIDSPHSGDETKYAEEIFAQFMSRAWRRSVTQQEVEQKLALFAKLRPACDDFQEAVIEVLATVLSSPKFLYIARAEASPQADEFSASARLSDDELATRLSMFLWCSTPDAELMELAAAGRLSDPDVLLSQTRRMLADPRAERFAQQFVRQWLGMQLLDFLEVDQQVYPNFDADLRDAMQQEPVAFFYEVLRENASVMDFLHADYALVNERLAKHYGLPGIYGPGFRKVALTQENGRGGLLTQAGLLAMNSDGKDSHPLKRGIWLLERLLNDPPPPPPPAVPVIDLTDPEIAKMTLKERMEDHRNDPACNSCHAKIDPWGIAFENFDAVGSWRTKINDAPVDASSWLFNKQKLDGVEGLKRYLLTHRQDQFAQAMVHKLTMYALGRPLTFSDRSDIDAITTDFRNQDDRLGSLIELIVTSELFQTK